MIIIVAAKFSQYVPLSLQHIVGDGAKVTSWTIQRWVNQGLA
jgi:hypothetical protein